MPPMKTPLLLFTVACYLLGSCRPSPVSPHRPQSHPPSPVQLPEDTVHITAVGDIMPGSSFPDGQRLPPADGAASFSSVQPFLKGDIVFANLEGCFLNSGNSSKCKGINPKNCYVFRMPEHYAALIERAGFNVLSLANNHSADFGIRGISRTRHLLDSLQIEYAGLLQKPFTCFVKNNTRYAFCAFSFNSHTPSINNIPAAKALISRLNEQADVVIVSFHGGGEGVQYESVTRRPERFYRENRGNVYAFAHAAVDAGADVVLGHGPHVTRAVEVYKNKFIAYSLGNFCTYGAFNLSGTNGYAPLLQLKTDKRGNFLYANIISVQQDSRKGLQIDTAARAFKQMKRLSDKDFAGHFLQFSPEGRISLKP